MPFEEEKLLDGKQRVIIGKMVGREMRELSGGKERKVIITY